MQGTKGNDSIFRDTTQIQYWICTALSSNTWRFTAVYSIPVTWENAEAYLVKRSAWSSRGNFKIILLISTSSQRWIIPGRSVILTFLCHRFFTIMIIHMLLVNALLVKRRNKKITYIFSHFLHSASRDSALLPCSPFRSAAPTRLHCRI